MPSVDQAFESPRLLLNGASEELQRLETADKEFFQESPYRLVIDADRDPLRVIHYITFERQPPPAMRLLTYRLVNDLRNALDHSIHGASGALGRTKLDNTYFPFRRNPADLEHVFAPGGRCGDVPVELHDTIRSFEPYPRGHGYLGGDDDFRALGTISNPNKHSIALRVSVNISGLIINRHEGAAITTVAPRYDREKNELVLFTSAQGQYVKYDLALPPLVAFDETVLTGRPIRPTLNVLTAKVATIVDTLEEKVREILSGRE